MGISQYLQRELLDHWLGGGDYSRPATVYLALYTVAPSNSGGGTECSGGSYARKSVTNNATNFPAASGGDPATKTLAVAQTFATPTANWGTVVAVGILDASSGGNLLGWTALETPREILNGDAAPRFSANELVITMTGV